MKSKILIVEDEAKLREVLCDYFISKGDEPFEASNGVRALELLQEHEFDAVLLDIMMPGLDGLSVCRAVRRENDVPIVFLTALSDEEDKLLGYELGADDYVTKPFGMMELISRIKAVLRRSKKNAVKIDDKIALGRIVMDVKKHEVQADGQVVTLTLKEFELLKRMMKNPDIVLTRDQLLEDIWGYDFDGETRTVDVHVRTLRQKLGSAGEQIQTVRGVGYRMSE